MIHAVQNTSYFTDEFNGPLEVQKYMMWLTQKLQYFEIEVCIILASLYGNSQLPKDIHLWGVQISEAVCNTSSARPLTPDISTHWTPT